MKLRRVKENSSHEDQMSLFGSVLDEIRGELGFTQTQLAEEVNTHAPNISRWIAGQKVSEEGLIVLCKGLPNHASRLLVAYLLDCTPAELQSLVSIEPVGGSLKAPKKVPPWDSLSPKARRILMQAAVSVAEKPGFLKVLESIVDLGERGGTTT